MPYGGGDPKNRSRSGDLCRGVRHRSARFSIPSVLAQGWEPAIRNFEEQDKVDSQPGRIVFTGSSSIRFWDSLVADMKPLDVTNRGFGEPELSDLDQYANRIVVAYHPRAAAVYENRDNDLAEGSGKTPEMVAADFRKFVQIVHGALPHTWIYILSIKPSKLRWKQWPEMKAANKMMQDFAATQQRVQYIDIATLTFDANGGLPGDLFKPDGLHPTAKLYAMWTATIKPILLQRFGRAATACCPTLPMPFGWKLTAARVAG